MDLLSQAVVGALGGMAATILLRRPQHLRLAAFAGVVGGLLPDADVIIKSAEDPLIAIRMHRHFTHALVAAPAIGLLSVPLIKLASRLKLATEANWKWVWAYATAGVLTHGPLDALTNYGTHLFWPFTERRESWNAISIIDPVFTLVLLGLVIFACRRSSQRLALTAVIFAVSYITLGFMQAHRAATAMQELAQSRGHIAERGFSNPTLGNLLAWRIVYEHAGYMYSDGVHLGWDVRLYPGSSAPLFQLPEGLLPANAKQRAQYNYFHFFSQGWIVADQTGRQLRDARFSALPTEIGGFWGIQLTPEFPEKSVSWMSYGGKDVRRWPHLRAMIMGEPLPVQPAEDE